MSTSKSIIRPFKAVTAGDMSGNITGEPTSLERVDGVQYYVEWSGTSPVGNLSIEFLEIGRESGAPEDVWTAVNFGDALGTNIPISGNTGAHTIIFTQTPFTKIRPIYTRTSGTGSIDITIVAKEG